MRVVCSYCELDLGEKEPLDDPSVSHGMCGACQAHYRRQLKGLSLGEYLDDVSGPVLVVDEDVRMIAANRLMAELLGQRPGDLVGLRGGEVLECAYARRPGGCGQQVHCRTCAIRNSVKNTFSTGEPCVRVPAFLERKEGRLDVLVSTRKRGPVVQVLIENAPAGVGRPAPRDSGAEPDREARGSTPSGRAG
jgi:PAS domain-containing protein